MIKVSLIRTPGCTHCAKAKAILEKMKSVYPDLMVEEIDMSTPKGQELVSKHNIMASPGILVNDKFFAMGGATEEQFKEKFNGLKKES